MKNLRGVLNMPTVMDTKDVPNNAKGIHESVFRSYHIVEYVRELLERGVPGDVVLDILKSLQEEPPMDHSMPAVAAHGFGWVKKEGVE